MRVLIVFDVLCLVFLFVQSYTSYQTLGCPRYTDHPLTGNYSLHIERHRWRILHRLQRMHSPLVSKIKTCMASMKIHMVSLKHPKNHIVLGFVNTRCSNTHVYVTMEGVSEDLSGTLIHECTHLALQSQDYAYIHNTRFKHLRGPHRQHNADSITKVIQNNY